MAVAPNLLIPMIRVQDVKTSIAFYAKLGFHVRSSNIPPGSDIPSWTMLEGRAARLMITSRGEPPVAERHAVLFYLYYDDVPAAHAMASKLDLHPSTIKYPFYFPRGQFQLTDPDGYVLMVAHT